MSVPSRVLAEQRAALPDYQALFEASPNPYLVLSPSLDILAVNEAYCRVTMTERADILGRHIFDAFPDNPDDPAASGVGNLRQSLERVLELRQPDAMAIQRYDIRDSGSGSFLERHWAPYNVPALNDKGEVSSIIHYAEDVTELIRRQEADAAKDQLAQLQQQTIDRLRDANSALARQVQWNNILQADVAKRTQELRHQIEERTKAEEDLRETKAFLDAAIAHIPGVVFVKRADTLRYALLSRAGEDLLGRPGRKIVGKSDHDVFPRALADQLVQRDRALLSSRDSQSTTEEQIETPEHGVRTLKTTRVTVLGKDGRPQYLLGLSQDITEQRAMERQLRQAIKMEAVGHLTGGVAHDFNNLLGIIIGNLDVAIERLSGDPEARDLITAALDGALRGADLTRRLLAFSRAQPLRASAVDLNKSLPQIAGMLKRTLGEHIRIVLHDAHGLWPAVVDVAQLDEAILNLAINARDAMPRGGTLTIETANVVLDEEYVTREIDVTPGAYVMVAVSDTGTGMSPDVAQRVFEPFFTTKAEGKGTGLGLSMVYGFVKQSGGHVKIYSEEGHGTSIKIYLPRADAPALDALPAEPAPPIARGRERVLVVEDNDELRLVTIKQLTGLGYRALEAQNGQDALEVLAANPTIDLLFTDIVMPGGMTGTELAREARKLYPNLKILLTSGYTARAAANGFHDIEGLELLNKPFRRADLADRLKKLFQ